MKRMGLLVASYGTPRSEAALRSYYTHIRRGQVPSEAAIAELQEKYKAIGGVSPLAGISTAQAAALCAHVQETVPAYEWVLAEGYKHTEPFVEEAVASLAKQGVVGIVSIVLNPFPSAFVTDSYHDRVEAAAKAVNLPVYAVRGWSDQTALVDYWTAAIQAKQREGQHILWTAHSVPQTLADQGDTYVESVTALVQQVAERLGVTEPTIAWQSEGPSGTWLTPTVPTVIERWMQEGVRDVLLAPIGFVSDHLEIQYDLDIQIHGLCTIFFMAYDRVPMPNANETFIRAMRDAVIATVSVDAAEER